MNCYAKKFHKMKEIDQKYCNDVVQGLWVGGRLSKMEILCIKSFVKNGHHFKLYSYSDIKNAPKKTEIKDAREILPESEVFKHKGSGFGSGSLSTFSNWFRYELLNAKGGWWVDMDVVCLRKFDFDRKGVISTYKSSSGKKSVNNCVMRLTKKDPILKYCKKFFEKKSPEDIEFAESGPELVSKAIYETNSEEYTVPPNVFCPYNHQIFNEIVEPPINSIKKFKRYLLGQPFGEVSNNTFAIHMWNNMWRENDLNKNEKYHERSLYEKLKRKYL